jgi:hypothetical protein
MDTLRLYGHRILAGAFAALALLCVPGLAFAVPVVFGMAGATTQTIGGLYKTQYEDFVSEQVLNKFPLAKLFKAKKADWAGQEIVHNAHTSRNVSPMFVGEDGAFAEAGQQGSIKIHIGQRKLMARVRITSEAMEDSMKSEAAFKSARKDEMTRIIDDIARMEEYALSVDGRGVLALLDGDPGSSTTVELDAPGGFTGDDFGNRFCLVGMYVGAVNPATGALRSGVRKITGCNADGTDITIDSGAPAAWADNDYLVQVANASVTDVLDTSYEKGFWGLTALFDDGTYRSNYFNAQRDQFPSYQSYVKASTGPISADLFQQVADVLHQRLDGLVTRLVAHTSIRRLYLQLTEADRRYSGDKLQKPDVGTVAFVQQDLTVGQVPFTALRTAPLGSMFLLDEKGADLRCYESEKGKWVDEDGSVLVRVGSGSTARDAFEAWYRRRKQYYAANPGKCARLDGITGQSLIVVREAGS